MASNANFISQFVMGGDPCTYKESGELQAEMSKLTHPARPDVDWRRVEKLSLALFRQNGVELQTQVCYVLAITRRQGLAGMADGLGSLDILLQRWLTSGRYRYIPEYHCSVGSQKKCSRH